MVAMLGTIEAVWLESFWASAPQPELRVENWELRSLQHRTAFWQDVLDRMAKVGDNRLSKDERVAVRRAIHKVVPWVMEPERKRLALLDAQDTYGQVKQIHEWCEKDVARDEQMIKEHTEKLKENRTKSAEWAEKVMLAGLQIAKLQHQ
jgi:hypothetical protein